MPSPSPRSLAPVPATVPLVLVVLLLGATVASAGLGTGDSSATTIDTQPPRVTVDQLPENTLVQGGEPLTFHWTTGDENPGTTADHFLASVVIDGAAHTTITFYPDIDDYTWEWTAPDVSSGDVHLEVVVQDAFGNSRTGTTNSFTVLSAVTAVPRADRVLALSAPAPNPFNPATTLRFSLPTRGRIDLAVYDARGRRIRTLLGGSRGPGDFSVTWDGRDDRGRFQAGGLYLFVLDVASDEPNGDRRVRLTRKAVLIP